MVNWKMYLVSLMVSVLKQIPSELLAGKTDLETLCYPLAFHFPGHRPVLVYFISAKVIIPFC